MNGFPMAVALVFTITTNYSSDFSLQDHVSDGEHWRDVVMFVLYEQFSLYKSGYES